jgi:hypothetical protein
MEMRLVNYFADQFNKQLGNGVDIRQSPKAMAKLKKQVKRTKEILSANTAAPISVESLYNDLDFRCVLTTCIIFTHVIWTDIYKFINGNLLNIFGFSVQAFKITLSSLIGYEQLKLC